ncbi:FAS1 domain-containing protein [Talaromyces proteolyticus]|uniref:FAS1 domain-containing protein n=1 Tax=Talaromyces proteolyticus TaxID=1131652 RepID=A0AAD4KGE7_9EURO|nr:FAS1 domain-containing protein [Talaromyces proteolyticus]KAH8691514.1 FAS1 domain-containing protein [Talaromyces proteolyticus]
MKFFKFSLLAFLPALVLGQNLTSLLSNTPQLSSLNALLSNYPSVIKTFSNLTNVTILAPSNQALGNYTSNSSTALSVLSSTNQTISDLLTYHILQGKFYASNFSATPKFLPTYLNDSSLSNVTGGQVVEGIVLKNKTYIFSGLLANSSVTQANLNFTGGVVHIIDKVLTIPANISYSAAVTNLTSVAGALNAGNDTNTVDQLHNVTMFAPINSAFQAIGSAVRNLSTKALNNILDYHIVNGTIAYSTDLCNGTRLNALNNETLSIRVQNGSIFVNSAKIVIPDLLVANGVVHIVDNVLNPNNTLATPIPTASSQKVAFQSASAASSIPFTSGITVTPTAFGTGAGFGSMVTTCSPSRQASSKHAPATTSTHSTTSAKTTH